MTEMFKVTKVVKSSESKSFYILINKFARENSLQYVITYSKLIEHAKQNEISIFDLGYHKEYDIAIVKKNDSTTPYGYSIDIDVFFDVYFKDYYMASLFLLLV